MRTKLYQPTDRRDAWIGAELGERYREILLLRSKIADAERLSDGKHRKSVESVNHSPSEEELP